MVRSVDIEIQDTIDSVDIWSGNFLPEIMGLIEELDKNSDRVINLKVTLIGN